MSTNYMPPLKFKLLGSGPDVIIAYDLTPALVYKLVFTNVRQVGQNHINGNQ